MKYKKFVVSVLSVVILGIIIVAGTVVYIDPFFHFHKPRPEFYYTLRSERYQNDGILKHFDYDSIITGTSMTQNFKTSEFNDLFDANSVKVPFAGARFKEVNDAIKVAYSAGKQVKYVVRSLDLYSIIADKDMAREDLGDYPVYLYNDNIFDDVKYILNKDAFFRHSLRILKDKIKGKKPGVTSFDEYKNWNKEYKFGKEHVLKGHEKYIKPVCFNEFTKNDEKITSRNIKANVIDLASEHPETTFYYFFPPYSIAWWGEQSSSGELKRIWCAEKLAVEMILECPNIKLFSFNLNTDITTNLDNYKDTTHYNEKINSDILKYMKDDIGLLTKDNYREYMKREYEFYLNYDYSRIM